ncbi:MAG: ThiF family adenylyltransferase [Candidatus Lokiarchaeota archaeon]
MNEHNMGWTDYYKQRVSRNIGHLTLNEQEQLRTSKIAIMGVGGLGGTLTDQLVRVGFQNISICDRDVYDETNLNRQLCTKENLGEYKVDHLKSYLSKIDPNVNITKYTSITSKNVDYILKDVKVVALSLDDPIASIIIARKCREKSIPMIESWGIPYLWAYWFTSESIDYESCYNLGTTSLSIEALEGMHLKSHIELFPRLIQFPRFQEIYDREKGYFDKMINGDIPYRSFAPFVHMTASYLAFEIIFAGVLHIKDRVKNFSILLP